MADNKPTVHSFGLGTTGGKFSSGYGASYGTVSTSMGSSPKPAAPAAAPPAEATPDAIAQWFERAMNAHKAGRLNEAAAGYQQVLAADARHADANHLFGMLFYQQGQFGKAIELIRRAIASKADADFLAHLGAVHMAAGQPQQAEQAYLQAIAHDPATPGVHYNLGVLYQGLQRPADAVAAYRGELALTPDDADSLYNLAGVLMAEGDLAGAITCCREMVTRLPNDWRGHAALGDALVRQGSSEAAEAALQQAIRLAPQQPGPCILLGGLYWDLRRWDDGAAMFERAAALNPAAADAWIKLAGMQVEREAFDLVLAPLQQGLARAPQHVDAHVIGADVYMRQGRFGEAEPWLDKALQLYRSLPVGAAAGTIDAAKGSPDALCVLGFYLLRLGRFADGWALSEWRYAPGRQAPDAFSLPVFPAPIPMWQGEPLAGKTILLVAEQGHGDEIQFIRYTELLKAQGATVWVSTKRPLLGLFSTLPWIDRLLLDTDVLQTSQIDYWSFPLSLPYRFATALASIPGRSRYLATDPAKVEFWRRWLQNGMGDGTKPFSVGLVWAGNPKHQNDKNRSIAFAELAPLLDVPGVTFVSLQMGERAADAAPLITAGRMLDAAPQIGDFSDSAALLDQLDLLITVDSAPAHLAGALGKPVWNLLPLVPDWRWLLQRDDSPWYPSMRLFRQRELKNWDSVVAEVAQALRQRVAH